jgi:hypothetical protein
MRPARKAQVHGGSWRIIDKRDRTITTSSYINSNVDKSEAPWQGSSSDGETSSSVYKEVDLPQDSVIRTDENNEPTYTGRDEIQESESEESPAWNVMHGSLNMCIEAISRLERDNTDYDRISLEGILHLLKGVLHTSQELKQQSFQKRKEEGKMISLVSSLREVCAKQKRVIKSMKAGVATATDRNLFACCQSTQTDETMITIVEPQPPLNNNNDNNNSGCVELEDGSVSDNHHVNRANRFMVTRTLDHTNQELKSISLNKLQELKYSSEHEMLVDQLVQAQNNSSIQGTMMKILQSKLDRLEGQLSSCESKLQEEKKRADSTMRVVLSLESIVEKQRAIISSSSLSLSHSHSGHYSKKEQKDSSSNSGRKPSAPRPMK